MLKRKLPSAAVVVTRLKFLPSFFRATVAPEIACFCGSSTVPFTVDEPVCAKALPINSKEQISAINHATKLVLRGGKRFILIDPPRCLGLEKEMGLRLQIPKLESCKPEFKDCRTNSSQFYF